MWTAGLDELEIKIAGKNINNLRYADDITLMSGEEELKNFWMKVKDKSEKAGLKLSIQKMKIIESRIQSHHLMANRWGNNGKQQTLFIFLGSKITADGDCSH